MMESLSPHMLLGALLVVVPAAVFVWLVVVGRRQPTWLVNFNAFVKSKSQLERSIGHTVATLVLTTIAAAFFAGLELLGVRVPSHFHYWTTFWMPMIGGAIFSILFVALFDAKGPTISEDWLDWKRDDGTKGPSG